MNGLVVFPDGLVVHWKCLDGFCGQRPDVDHSIGPITLQRVQLQVALEVSSIESRDGQSIAVTSLRGAESLSGFTSTECDKEDFTQFLSETRLRPRKTDELGTFGKSANPCCSVLQTEALKKV